MKSAAGHSLDGTDVSCWTFPALALPRSGTVGRPKASGPLSLAYFPSSRLALLP